MTMKMMLFGNDADDNYLMLQVVVTMEHCAKSGAPKILPQCNLPLTGKGVVDVIITELAVFVVDKTKRELVLTEFAEGVTVEEIRAKTAAPFTVSPNLRPMLQ